MQERRPPRAVELYIKMKLTDEINERLFGALPRGRAVILGLGVSNLPLARMLAARGCEIEIRDAKNLGALGEPAAALLASGASFICGCDPTHGLCQSSSGRDVIFRSPGIRPDVGDIPAAVAGGALLTSEMEWFCDASAAPIFAITGSDGKTTTTTLTHLLLSRALERQGGRAVVGGNIGTPLLDRVSEIGERDAAVLELSSFQLMTMSHSPRRAAITNITPNHLNWHTDMAEYTAAKYRVFGPSTELLVLNAKSPAALAAATHCPSFGGEITLFTAHADNYNDTVPPALRGRACAVFLRGDDIIFSNGDREELLLRRSDIKIPGLHNVENFMTAAALTRGIADSADLLEIARSFPGVRHRIEFVRELDGVSYYNSSIDSTPTRTEAALSVFDNRPIFILCGRDKHLSYRSLIPALFERSGGVVVSGEAIPIIRAAIEETGAHRGGVPIPVIYEDDLLRAVDRAREIASPGSAVVLSPSCTSFDRFRNFEERGDVFCSYVNSL